MKEVDIDETKVTYLLTPTGRVIPMKFREKDFDVAKQIEDFLSMRIEKEKMIVAILGSEGIKLVQVQLEDPYGALMDDRLE